MRRGTDLTGVRRLGANEVATEFQYLRPSQKATLLRECPDFYFAAARFTERFALETSHDEVLTTTEVAGLLAITPRAVRLAVQRGKLRAVGQDADGYLFDRGHVDDYLMTRRRRVVA